MRLETTASFDEQYRALRSGWAAVELINWSSVVVTGADRKRFLHNFCTNDIARLVPGDNCEVFFTNVKGKIVAHGLINCREDELLFLGTPGQGPRLVEHLDRYVIREDVTLCDTTSAKVFVLATLDELRDLRSDVCISWNLIARDVASVFELTPRESPFLLNILNTKGFVVAGIDAFDVLRIEAGVPLFGVDFDEHNLPQEVGRDRQAISFTKGCYLGQETVARIDALGHVNQRIVGLRFFGSDVPSAGAELSRAAATVGRVTSATYSPSLAAPLALAMIRRGANAAGTRLDSPVGECEVVELPLKGKSDPQEH
jgi:folate-binding protein YgfZ